MHHQHPAHPSMATTPGSDGRARVAPNVTVPYTVVRALMAGAPSSLADLLQRCAQPTAWPIDLPLLTCQAVGGDPRQAVMVAAAFELARLAARVLDDVEAVTIMTQAGAAHYLLAVAESHCREAIAALDRARGDPVAHQSLLDLLPDVLPAAGEKKHS